jgi:hypothetical protein
LYVTSWQNVSIVKTSNTTTDTACTEDTDTAQTPLQPPHAFLDAMQIASCAAIALLLCAAAA